MVLGSSAVINLSGGIPQYPSHISTGNSQLPRLSTSPSLFNVSIVERRNVISDSLSLLNFVICSVTVFLLYEINGENLSTFLSYVFQPQKKFCISILVLGFVGFYSLLCHLFFFLLFYFYFYYLES